MALMTTMTLTFGVLLSCVSGLICYVGVGQVYSFMSSVPSGDVIMTHPETALAGGVLLIVLGILCQPSRAY